MRTRVHVQRAVIESAEFVAAAQERRCNLFHCQPHLRGIVLSFQVRQLDVSVRAQHLRQCCSTLVGHDGRQRKTQKRKEKESTCALPSGQGEGGAGEAGK